TLSRQTLGSELVEVIAPVCVMALSKFAQVTPAVNSRRMQIVKHEAHRIISDRLHLDDGDVALACNGLALIGRMPLHLGARALHPQIFSGEFEALAAVEAHCPMAPLLAHPSLAP